MKKITKLFLLIAVGTMFVSACKKDDNNNDDDNNNGGNLPDAVFNLEITGAENHTFSFTLPENVATDNSINGSHLTSQQLMTITASDLPITWLYGIVAEVNSMATGTYNINPGMSSFTSSTGTGFSAVSGTLEITKASLYQSVTSIEDWFIDGTFNGTYEDTNVPSNTITVNGSFSGVNIKSQ